MIITIMGASSSGDNAKMELRLFGQRFYYVGFRRAYGLSRKKWDHCHNIFKHSGAVAIHAGHGTLSPSTAKDNSHCWLATFFDIIGDCLPDGTLHLPVAMTWHDVHAICEANHPPSTPLLTYSALVHHISTHFPHVHLPHAPRLGKCTVCLEFQQLWLRAKSATEAAAYHACRAEHLNLAAGEQMAYK